MMGVSIRFSPLITFSLSLTWPSRSSRGLVKARISTQPAIVEEIKHKVVEAVRRRYGDSSAFAVSTVIDQVVARALPSATPSITSEVAVGRTQVRGSATVEFALDPLAAAGVRLRGGLPAPQLYSRASFSFRGGLLMGRLEAAAVHVDAGFRLV